MLEARSSSTPTQQIDSDRTGGGMRKHSWFRRRRRSRLFRAIAAACQRDPFLRVMRRLMAAPVASRPASYRPIHLEPLEPRLLLTAVTLTDPDSNTIAAPTGTNIDVTFDGNLDTGTVDDTTVVVNALRGRLLATRGDAFSAAGSTLTIDPATDFFPGETVTVNVSTGVEDATNASVDPYVFQFTTTVAGGSGIYADSGQSLGGNVYTNDVALGDIDGDGDLDVFEANGHDRANRVWINQGGAQAGVEGTFVDSGQTLGSDRSYGVSLGDLDGDGDLDAYVANYLTGNRVWFNQGGIQLGTPGVFADSGQSLGTASSTAVCLGDVDGDGDLDAFVANRDYAPERVWLNNGFGFFTDSGQALGSDRGFGVTLGDLDNDGDLDAFVATRDGPDRVWINQGGLQGGTLGAFADNGQTLGSEESFDVSLGDVDGDGDLDAFVGTINSQSNHLWINQGGLQAGTIGTFADSGQTLGIYASYGVSLSDLDGDGDLDMFVANRLDGNRVWINQGGVQAGTLGVFVDTGQSMGIERSQGLAVGDLDGDGDLDAFIGNNYHPNRVWLNVNQDFGDAPDTFGTLTASDGARHNPLGPMLGTSRDAEADGLPTAGADGDDADGSDDEDGVTFIGVITPGVQNAEVSVVVSGGAAVLDAWIDFNGNGTFDVASERIFKGEDVAADTNTLTFDVPADALPGVTYARFRLSTAGVDGPRGYAPDGEIEDYAVTIAPPGGFGIFGSTNQDFGASATMTVAAQDVDGDGDVDILEGNSPAFGDDSRLWLNDGTGVFVDSGLSLGTTDVRGYALGDTDGDGDVDIVVANGSMQPNRVLLNTGTGAFFNSGQTLGTDETFTVALGDVDGDGDLDIADGNSNGPNRIWLNNGAGVFTDSGQVLVDNSFGVESTFSVALADLDNDGDLDIVYGSFGPNRVWLNDGSGVFTNTEQDLGAVGARTYEIAVGDVDDDGDLDIVDGIDNGGTRVWLNDGSAVFSDSGQALNGGAGLTRSVKLGDIDGDGDLDIVEGLTEATVDDSPNLIWLNDGTGLFTNSGQLLGNGDTRSVVLGDFNGDGHLDFFAGNLGDGNVNHLWLNAVDLGDAPDTYGTLLSSDGARHSATGPRLGATRDDDADGAPSVNADGDDTTGIDDEDGVTFDTIMVGALNATVAVNVQGAAGKLDAWIDFNGDGSFGGPGEHIFSSVDVTETDNVLTFDVPSWAVAGVTYARFRLSTAGGLGPRGAAPDGEVEDYAVTITPPSSATSVFTDKQTINVALPGSYPYSVIAADIDGDGDMDIAGALERENTIVWYENDGSQNFIEHVIDSSIRTPKGVFTTDLDGDGDMDVLGAGWRDGLIVWYENDGAQSFTRHTITNQADYVDFVYAADMDNDGDLDVLGATAQKFSWYENSGSESFAEHVVNPSSGDGTSMLAADVDRDGDMDLVTSSLGNDTIAWYENDGSQSFTQRIISTSADGAWAAFAMDIDGDGDMDVLSASYRDDKIAWYENDGSENFTERVISTAADRARSVFAADVDGDGDVDVLSASSNDDKVAWYENNGSETFTERVISTTTNGAWGVFAADMDGDGDMDVVAPARYEGRFVWFEDVGMDFGDAPAPYPTTLTDNGARHISIGPTLGASRDEDLDGAPSVNADGDDSTGIDDEDGVTFGTMMVGALDATVTVNVQGGAGKLDAWIDFNGDGSFGGPGEHVFDSVDVAATDNVLTFDVPSWAIAGVTYARFRLSTAGDLGPSGAAVDGEVEDYAVTIVDPALASGVFGGQNVIDTSTDHPFSVFAADIDGDGDIDMLSASQFDNTIAWYENDGSQNFTAHIISTGALSAFSVFAADVDGDGDVDVLSASYNNSKIAWYENDGAQNFTEHTVGFATGAADVFAADVDGDGDGDLDVLSAAIGGNRIAWYENDGSQSFTAHTITTAANGAISVFAADVDSDGDMDVLSASEFDDKIAWYENDGTQSFTEHAITTTANGAIDVFAADVDGDGDIDVLSAAFLDDAIVWYENDGSQSFTPHTISADADGARSVFAVDIDGDGDIDVLSAEDYDNEIAWYENDGSQSFTPHSISTAASGATSVFAADVD
ncbi:MAG: hypothetical protein GC159_24080, partial [Phycisphaera sp.]|nr:hypothetical protein [Phycisphaera sp.]